MRGVTVLVVLITANKAYGQEESETGNYLIDSLIDRLTRPPRHPGAQSEDLDKSTLGKSAHFVQAGRSNLVGPALDRPSQLRAYARKVPVVHASEGSTHFGLEPRRSLNMQLRLPPIHSEGSEAAARFGGAFERSMSGLSGSGASSRSMGKEKLKPEDVNITSDVGMDYTELKEFLAKGEFQNADDETRALLIKLAGPGAVQRKWVYFTEVKTIPVADMKTLDDLWVAYSDGKFGYSVQKSMFNKYKQMWRPFLADIKWKKDGGAYTQWPGEFTYNVTKAVRGHLPLTNHLRGFQLHEAIFGHPAFNKSMGKAPA